MNETEEKVLDHNYDGIQEYDNPLPGWWLATFYGAIIFSIFYIGYYHYGSGPSPTEELARDMAEIQAREMNARAKEPGPTEEFLAAIFQDPARREAGHAIFTERCASCHGPQGGGMIGPNLTDAFWIHGRGTLLDLAGIVSEGVPEKGMPPWKLLLKKEEIHSVVAYVKSLKDSHPANAKEPQGEPVKE